MTLAGKKEGVVTGTHKIRREHVARYRADSKGLRGVHRLLGKSDRMQNVGINNQVI